MLGAIALLLAGSDALAEILGEPRTWIRQGRKECRLSAEIKLTAKRTEKIQLILRSGDGLSDVLRRNAESCTGGEVGFIYSFRPATSDLDGHVFRLQGAVACRQ